jgi:predicted nucleic acid-binding protein
VNRDNPIILVDTNVWVDNYLGERPNSNASRHFIDVARASGAQLTYAVHSLTDFFYIMQSCLKHGMRSQEGSAQAHALAARETAWACVEHLRTLATAIGADESDAWRACKYRVLNADLEDNFVLAAAERVPVDFIVTNDKQLLRKSTVNAYTPEDAVLMMQATRMD